MKHINKYKLFENNSEYDRIMSRLLHLYGHISLEKESASSVIKKIIFNTNGRYYELGEDVDINYQNDQDKVRFKDYFESLIKSKDSRGHNFEGMVAGLFNGDLSTRGEKWDLKIDKKNYSVKFIDNGSKAPEIGSFRKIFTDMVKLNIWNDYLDDYGELTSIFKSDNIKLKLEIFDEIFDGVYGWIIGYPVSDLVINLDIISYDEMKNMIVYNYMVTSPKGGLKSKYSLALSATFKDYVTNRSRIIIPELTLDELKNIYLSEDEYEWASNVFGRFSSKIRPDLLRYIKNNSDKIAQKLIKFKDFN